MLQLWLLEDLPLLSYALTNDQLMQSSHDVDAGHEMKRSLYQLGMSTESWGGLARGGGRGRGETETFIEYRRESTEGNPERKREINTHGQLAMSPVRGFT